MALPLLGEMVALFVVSVLIAYLCYRVRLVPIAGFLLAGVVLGPGALGLVRDVDTIYGLANIGVILLLFTIGAELSLAKLARLKHFIVVGGGIQSAAIVVLVALVLMVFGIGWRVGVFTGFLVVLSSTAIVLKLFQEQAQTDTPAGQVSLALLIFQDLAMVIMVLLVPVLSGAGEASLVDVVLVLVKSAVVIALVLLLARRTIPWLLEQVAHTRREELFLLTVVAACFGTAWVTSLFGVGLALGAFLAGLVVSESRYSGYALSEILPLRTVFNAIFFVSIGMLLDLGFLVEHLPTVAAVAASVLVLKVVVTGGTVLLLGYPVRIAATTALALAQICESSFVLERAGAALGLSPAGQGEAGEQAFIAVAVLLMVLTPLLMQAGPTLGAWLSAGRLGRNPFAGGALARWGSEPAPADAAALDSHVIVVGYGPAGRRLVRVMQASRIPFVILELNPQTVAVLEAEGLPVLYGDASRLHILQLAGIERAKLCVVVINDPAAVHPIVEMAHFLNPTLQVVVRARFLTEVEPLQGAGADVVVTDELEAAVRVSKQVLEAYLVPPDVVARRLEASRADEEPSAEASAGPMAGLKALSEEGLHTRTVTVRRGAIAAGMTLAELALRQVHGLTVLAVRRDGKTMGSPDGSFRVEVGDDLVLVGTADQFSASAHLFRWSRLEVE